MNYKNNKNDNKIINITMETEPMNPRSKDFCDTNITKIACTHSEYALGDEGLDPETELDELTVNAIENAFDSDANKTIENLKELMLPESFSKFTELMQYIDDVDSLEEYFTNDYAYADIDELMRDLYTNEKEFILRDVAVIRQISIYDHSGVSIYLGDSSGFDYSSVGYIYVTQEDVRAQSKIPGIELADWKADAERIINEEFDDYKNFVDDCTSCFVLTAYDADSGNEIDMTTIHASFEEEALEKYVGKTKAEAYRLIDKDIDSIIGQIKEDNRLEDILGEGAPSSIKNHNKMLTHELNKTELPDELKDVMINFMDEYLKSDQRGTDSPVWIVEKLQTMFTDEAICDSGDIAGVIIGYGESWSYREDEQDSLVENFIEIANDNELTIKTTDELKNMSWDELIDYIDNVYSNEIIAGSEFMIQHYYTEWKFTGDMYLTEAQARASVQENDTTRVRVESAWKDRNASRLARYKHKVIKGDNNE